LPASAEKQPKENAPGLVGYKKQKRVIGVMSL